MAERVIDLLMDEKGYKYLDKVAGATNDVCFCWTFSSAGPPSDPPPRPRQISSQEGNTGGPCPDRVSDASQKPLFTQSFESAAGESQSPSCLPSGAVGFHILQSPKPQIMG